MIMMKKTSTIALIVDLLVNLIEGNFIVTILIRLRRTTTIRIGGEDGETVISQSHRDRLTDESATSTKENIHKIPSQVLVKFNPDEGASSRYCDNLRRLCSWYGEASVMLAVPATLEGRALDWFGSNVRAPEAMRSVEAWIECLQEEFAIDTAKARKEANACTYDPTRHRTVMDYFVLIMFDIH